MHISSYEKMQAFRHRYFDGKEKDSLLICDLGSQDVNGSYRTLFSEPAWQYIGLDMASGNNVDVVLRTPYVWREIKSRSVDVVISGQAFEHIQYFWITMLEVARVLKPGGLCCILAPSSGPEHRYPLDCWRFYPDGMASLGVFAQMKVIEVNTQWDDLGYDDGSDWWHDTMLICQKPDKGILWDMKSSLKRWLQHRAMTIGMR
jgi:SAM-dependent methyltransferase